MPEKKLNLWQKLVEIRKQVAYIKKEARGFNYNYADGEAVLSRIVPLMNDLNVLLKSEVVQVQPQVWHGKDKYGKDKDEMLYVVPMTMTWINADNPEEREECQWAGTGCNGEEKGYGSALTYAERYFMLKFFNIATGKDDPDNYENTTRNHQEATTQPVAATNGTEPATAEWISKAPAQLEKGNYFRKVAGEYKGVLAFEIPTLPEPDDKAIHAMLVKEKRTKEEHQQCIRWYIDQLPVTDKVTAIGWLKVLSVFKDGKGNYGRLESFEQLEALDNATRLGMLHGAAKGAVVERALDEANAIPDDRPESAR